MGSLFTDLPNQRGEIVIYGTGSLARMIYDILLEMGIGERLAFFLESNPVARETYGKPIVGLSDVERCNEYLYVLASYGNPRKLEGNLESIGVDPSRIYAFDSLSVEDFQDRPRVERIAVHPCIDDPAELEWWLGHFEHYTQGIHTPLTIDVATHLDGRSENASIHFVRPEAMDFASYDLVLVTREDALVDVLHVHDDVCLIDPYTSASNYLKILETLHFTMLTPDEKRRYAQISRTNFERLIEQVKERDKALVFGSGPSVGAFIHDEGKQHYMDESVRIVCNAFFNSSAVAEQIRPDIYVLLDSLFYVREFRPVYEWLIERGDDAYLVVPNRILPLLLYRHPELEDQVIGMEERTGELHFPIPEDVSVDRNLRNVVRSWSIPLASTLCDTIYIVGCDGTSVKKEDTEGRWRHNDELIRSEIVNMSHIMDKYRKKPITVSYVQQHMDAMEEVLQFGETQGKTYYSLTDSQIPALKKRLLLDS